MFGWGSSSTSPDASSSKSTESSSSSAAPEAPNRQQRQACWDGRDAYFECLTKNGVLIAGEEKGVCQVEKQKYEKDCGRSWIDYFNKRRILEIRQKATLEAAAKQREQNPANIGR